MRRQRKSKKIRIIAIGLIIAILVIALIVVLVTKSGNNQPEQDKNTVEEGNPSVYKLPSTSYKGVEVTNIELEYRKELNQTILTMMMKNASDSKIEGQLVDAVFYDKDNIELLRASTVIEPMEVGGESSTSIILTGDFSTINKVEIIQK